MPSVQVSSTNHEILTEIASTIAQSHRVIVVTGAGISTNCGIPDFRSSNGLRTRRLKSLLDELSASHVSPVERDHIAQLVPPTLREVKVVDLFESVFVHQKQTSIVAFNILCVLLRRFVSTKRVHEEGTHRFIRDLRDSGRLLRCYTQNIDALDTTTGLVSEIEEDIYRAGCPGYDRYSHPQTEVVPLHGSLNQVRCRQYDHIFPWVDEYDDIFLQGTEPSCPQCETSAHDRASRGKRQSVVGNLRPNIVLYGESHPQQSVIDTLIQHDIASDPEVLVILGTSMRTDGSRQLIRDLARSVHQSPHGRVISVNRSTTMIPGFSSIIDTFVNMDCDQWVQDVKLRRSDILDRVNGSVSGQGEASFSDHLDPVQLQREKDQARLWVEALFF